MYIYFFSLLPVSCISVRAKCCRIELMIFFAVPVRFKTNCNRFARKETAAGIIEIQIIPFFDPLLFASFYFRRLLLAA